MLAEITKKISLFDLLYRLDVDLSKQHRNQGCRFCDGALHSAYYQRKPRGGSEGIPDEYLCQLSLCCSQDSCRRRHLPPSCRFMGRFVYWGGIILVILALRQNRKNSRSLAQLKEEFGVSQQTIARWHVYFRTIFPNSPQWQQLRGLVSAKISNHDLPTNLLDQFITNKDSPFKGLAACLLFLASGSCKLLQARIIRDKYFPQTMENSQAPPFEV